jgi:5-(carboxyamino)imidazole ribonucleotide mutase
LAKVRVSVVMGSKSDYWVMKECLKLLDAFDLKYEVRVLSAHRNPEVARDFSRRLEDRGIEVVIAGAGGAAHLPGFIASHTDLPVIGVPMASSPLKGVDALYSIAQMPGGVPVACMAVGEAGAKNAATMAARILALQCPEVKAKLSEYRTILSKEVSL